jgi:hypothetical protein
MALTELLFGRKGGAPALDLARLQVSVSAGVGRYAGQPVDADLVRARLADGCRVAVLPPLLPTEFDALAVELDEEAWRRLAILIGLLDLDEVRAALAGLSSGNSALEKLLAAAFVGLARQTSLLTLELLRQSPLRVEELARKFVAALGAGVRGEAARVSQQRLKRLDYGRLLAEAEQARQSAAERVEKLRKLQEEHQKRGPRRGKW